MQTVSHVSTPVNRSPRTGGWDAGAAKRMPRPAGTPAPLPMDELKRMYDRRARFNQQMAAKAARKGGA
jgi:hypothetical protein